MQQAIIGLHPAANSRAFVIAEILSNEKYIGEEQGPLKINH
jgi:hypothetical protein